MRGKVSKKGEAKANLVRGKERSRSEGQAKPISMNLEVHATAYHHHVGELAE